MTRETLGFAIGALLAALVGLAALAPAGPTGWALAGWAALAVPGILTGARLAQLHGRAGARFVVAMGAGLLARLLGAGTVAILAGQAGGDALVSATFGLLAGFLPLAVFEGAWFVRRAAAHRVAGGRA